VAPRGAVLRCRLPHRRHYLRGARQPRSRQEMRAWRLAAWLVCAAVFAAHLAYEHFRVGNPPARAALHVAVAVALGAGILAVWVNVRSFGSTSGRPSPRAPLALVVYPVVTGVPAFAVALVVAGFLSGGNRT
jgi:hypothetical protein